MSLRKFGFWAVLVGSLVTFFVRVPELVIPPQHHVLRFWVDCNEESWPEDLKPILVIRLADGDWTHRFRFKAFEQDAQYLNADCKLDKIEASLPFRVEEWPGATADLMQVNQLYRLDTGRQTAETPQADGLRDGFGISFESTSGLSYQSSISNRQIFLSAQYAVSDEGDDAVEEPGKANLANAPFPSLPVVFYTDTPVTTNATALGRGTGRLGARNELTYEFVKGELSIVLKTWAFGLLSFLLGLLGPALFGFGFGIFSTQMKDRLDGGS